MPSTRYWLGGFSGSNTDASVAGNYSASGVPANGDTLYVEAITPGATLYDIAAGLNQSAVTLARLGIGQSFLKPIGLTSAYYQVSATLFDLGYFNATGQGLPVGSTRIKVDLGSVASTVNIYNTCGTASEAGLPPVRLLNNSGSSVVNARGGFSGVAVDAIGETSTILTANVYGSATKFNLGAGVTATNYNQYGGTGNVACNPTNVLLAGGSLALTGKGALTIAAMTLNGPSGCTLDLSAGEGVMTFTALTVYPGSRIIDPNGRMAASQAIVFAGGADGSNVQLLLGYGRTLTKTS